MRLEWARPGVLRITSHAYEAAALVASARYVVDTRPPEIPEEAVEQLRQILGDYDEQAAHLRTPGAGSGNATGTATAPDADRSG